MPSLVNCLGVGIAQFELSGFLEWWDGAVGEESRCESLAIVNAHTLNLAYSDPNFRAALNGFSLVINDGAGVELCGRWQGKPFPYNFNGTDLLPLLLRRGGGAGLRVFLFGAKPGIAEKAADALLTQAPALLVSGVLDGFSDLPNEQVVARINASGANVLLVAMGNPKQELWISAHAPLLKVSVAVGVGALFDFLSGSVARAPRWMRSCRLEWLFRLCLEPRRLARRYLMGNLQFLVRVLLQHSGRRTS